MVVGRVVSRLGDGGTFRLGIILAALGLGGAAAAPSVPIFVLCLIPAALGSGMAIPTLLSLISQAVPPAYQGSLQGVTSSLEGLARVVGPLWGNGALALSPLLPFGSAALVLAAIGVASSVYVQRLARSHAHTESASERVG